MINNFFPRCHGGGKAMLIITCLSLTVGFLPMCLLICSCAVQLMGLENSPLRKHRGSLAVPRVPNSCFIRLREEKKLASSGPSMMTGFRQSVTREMRYQRWLGAARFAGNLCIFLNFPLKILNAAPKSQIPPMQIRSPLKLFSLVWYFQFLRTISLLLF